MIGQKQMTPEIFITLAEQYPERRFDFMDGEMVEVSPKKVHGQLQALIAHLLALYLEQHPQPVKVYTEVLHELAGALFIPDVSVNRDEDSRLDYFTTPPLLAVEIRSDTQSREAQRRKARAYIAQGTALVWLVMPGETVEVYRAGAETAVLTAADTLDGGAALPGLALPVQRLLTL